MQEHIMGASKQLYPCHWLQGLLMDVLTCADVQQTADNAHFFVFEETMRCGMLHKLRPAHWYALKMACGPTIMARGLPMLCATQ